jgi:hypothetical protein
MCWDILHVNLVSRRAPFDLWQVIIEFANGFELNLSRHLASLFHGVEVEAATVSVIVKKCAGKKIWGQEEAYKVATC